MNKYTLAGLSLLIGLGLGYLLFSGNVLGGITNYDSLQLQPSSSSDDALDVRDSGGTSRLVVSGSGVITISGAFTATGESRVNRIRTTGSIISPATSSVITLTAAQLCDNSIIVLGDWTPAASSTAILNLPTAEAMFADCLPTNGDRFSLIIENNASTSASSTLITVGSASTTLYGFDTSEDVLLGGSRAFLEVWRAASNDMSIGIQLWVEAD